MTNRKITDLYDVEFTPFDNYGVVVPGMSWHKISYNRENGGRSASKILSGGSSAGANLCSG